MTMLARLSTCCALLTLMCSACEDDAPPAKSDRTDSEETSSDAGTDAATDAGDPLYLIGSSVQTTDNSTLLLWTTPELDGAELELSEGEQIIGGVDAVSFNGAVYVGNSEKFTVTRYELEDDKLVAGDSVSFANRGLMYVSYLNTILSSERAFLVNPDQLEIIEWNPTEMTITKTHSLEALAREGWGVEYRGGFIRKSDGKFFFYWTYTNQRAEFVNDFVLGVFDTKTDTLTFEINEDCPASAGFGGFFDEQEDLYLIADSFGLYTQFQYEGAKPACVLRVKKGEDKLDSDFKVIPEELMGGKAPWGFYYLADGVAYTSGVDPAVFEDHDSLFEVIFAPVHTGWLLDFKNGEAKQIEDLPLDGVGFESHRVNGRLLVPRTTGEVVIEDIMSSESTLFEIKPDATAKAVFKLPGYIAPVVRVR